MLVRRSTFKGRTGAALPEGELKKFIENLLKVAGGQMPAAELLADPSLFFLDEPTSGLDVAATRAVRALLARLLRKCPSLVVKPAQHLPAAVIRKPGVVPHLLDQGPA